MPEPGFLGIDLGTSSVKALLVDGMGQVVGRGSAAHPLRQPQPGHAEQDPDDWWHATITAVHQAKVDETPVTAIGLTGQMHGTVLLGDDLAHLAPAIIWADARSGQAAAELTARVGAERLIGLAGGPVAAGFQAATVRWLQQHRPALWRTTHRVLLPKDELRRRLTDQIATDPSDAAGTGLFDIQRRQWSAELLRAADVTVSHLPPVQASDTVAGTLSPVAAAELGLPAGIPVITGAGDAPAGALGAGLSDSRTLLLTLSTGAQVMAPAENVRTDPRGRMHTICGAVRPGPNRPGWYLMGATLNAGLAVTWLLNQVLGTHGDHDLERLNDLAATAPAGAHGLLFLPYLIGERTPLMDPSLRGAFVGLTARHGPAELARAVLEGVMFACFDAFHVLRELHAAPEELILAGGGARGPLWPQMAADLFGLPARPLATTEQSALGAAVLAAAAATGRDPVEIGASWVRYGPALVPRPSTARRYATLFTLFQEARASVAEISHRLGQFAEGQPETVGNADGG